MGEKVEAFHRKTNSYRTGKIVAVHKSTGLYDVSFDEGGEELDISRDLIRSITSDGNRNEEQPSSSAYKVGDQVEANREGKDIWRYAVIAKVHPDSYYDVVYTDRARENRIPPNYVRGLYASVDQFSATSNKANLDVFANPSGSDDITVDDVCLGMVVEARYHGGKQYFTGTITRISKRSNTVDILYEDGDAETFLPLEYVRLIPGKSIRTNNSGNAKEADPPRDGPVVQQEALYPVGTAVEGNFQGKNRWYPAVVTRVRNLDNGECRYAVRYKDGDFEENVPQHMLRMPKLRPLNESREGNDGTAASSKGNAASSAATTSATTSNSTDPAADSPLKNRRVTPSSTPSESNGRGDNASTTDASPSRHHHRHHRHHHRSHHKKTDSKADKNRANDDDDDDQLGNFGGDDHDDHPEPILSTKIAGDLHLATSTPGKAKKHRHHHRHHRHHGDEPSVSGSSTARQDSRSTTPLPAERPVEVEAPSQGSRSRTAPSRNDSPPSAGRMVPQELESEEQRPTTAPTATASKPDKKASDSGIPLNSVRIEANFQGKGVWFPGRLIKERGNGTVDVLYDDGDKELGVPIDRIRPIHTNRPAVDPVVKATESTAPADSSRLSESQERNNGADKSQGRHHHHHRKEKKPSGPGEFAVGDRVMADFRNQGQYYPGTVKRLHSHGLTVDILYDDGDVEKKVPTERVQKMDSFSKPTAAASAASKSAPAPAATAPKAKPAVDATTATTTGTTNIGELDIGALVETQELNGTRPISGWQPGRILRLYPSQAAADIKLLQPSPVTGNEMLVLQPWANIRFLTQQTAPIASSNGSTSGNKTSPQRAQPAPAAVKPSEPPVVATFPQDSSDQQLQQALALNSNDVAALREFLRRKDAEIERLRQQVTVLQQSDDTGRRTAPVGAGRPGRQLVNAAPTAATPAVDESNFTPHAPRTAENGPRPSRAVNGRATSQAPIAAGGEPTETAAPVDASAIEQLSRANEELKRSVAFLGQKFTMVVEELVRVKNHEEKLAKHVKKQGELIKRLYHDRGTSLPTVNHHYEDF